MKLDIDICENTYWLCLWSVIVCGVVIVFVSLSIHYNKQDALVVEAIKQGASVAEVQCAFADNYGRNPTCIVMAAKTTD